MKNGKMLVITLSFPILLSCKPKLTPEGFEGSQINQQMPLVNSNGSIEGVGGVEYIGGSSNTNSCQGSGGTHILMIVDNSSSNMGPTYQSGPSLPTDCPNRTPSSQAGMFDCPGDSFRKKGVLAVADTLRQMAGQSGMSSTLSIVKFSTTAEVVASIPMSSAQVPSSLGAMMDFTKVPRGKTNYSEAFATAGRVPRGNGSAIAILLSDGFPTQNARMVYNSAMNLRNSGFRLITLIYNVNQSFAQLGADHERVELASNSTYNTQDDLNWIIGRGRKPLVVDFSDAVYFLNNPANIPAALSALVQQYSQSCK